MKRIITKMEVFPVAGHDCMELVWSLTSQVRTDRILHVML